MRTSKVLLAAATACIATLGIHAPGLAQQKSVKVAAKASDTEISDRAVNQTILNALLQRRSQVARSAGTRESKRPALEFLDNQIAKVTKQLGN